MIFYPTNPSETNIGLKFVLWGVKLRDQYNNTDQPITYDWGFANWNGKSWDPLNDGDGPTLTFFAEVVRWANTIDPEILLKEESKIISL